MKVIYVIFFSFIMVITIFITIFQTSAGNYISSSTYLWPTPAYHQISSYFGYREKPTQNASSYHQGIDILAAEGSGVLAIEDGIISYAGWHQYGGYMVKIEHASQMISVYEHLSPHMLVKEGELVQKGDVIAKVGPKYVENGKLNGATTGVHLHFGIMKNGRYINPLELLK